MVEASKERRARRLGILVAGLGAWLALAPAPARAQPPLFAFAQLSDVQASDAVERARFDQVLAAIAASGDPGALLPHPVAFALIVGDHVVQPGNAVEWSQYRDRLDAELTARGIPFLAVPGNHDQDEFGVGLYESTLAPAGVWDSSSAWVRGQNGLVAETGWAGLRFVGINNSWSGWNTVKPAERAQLEAIVSASAAAGENVFVVAHHPHDDQGVVPLAQALETPGVVGYLRGHTGAPHATQGLAGIANPVWDLSSESVWQDAALLYYEVFATELRVHVLRLVDAPTGLPAPAVIPLPHPLWPAAPAPPQAGFAATPDAGRAPLEVAFVDLSANDATSWLWDFGDGASSTQRHPVHVYADGGSYDVTLVATNAQGGDAVTGTAAVELLPPLASATFRPVADARVSAENPSQNYGASSSLRTRLTSSSIYQSYLRFAVSGLGSQAVVRAVLRVYVTDPSVDGGRVTEAQTGWQEATLTWANAPGIGTVVLDDVGTAFPDTWVEFDVSGLVTGEGTYDFGLSNASSNSAIYSSREGAHPPELVVYTAPAVPSLGGVGIALQGLALLVAGVGALARRRAARAGARGAARPRP